MISMEEMQGLIGELLDELPEYFFRELNGGVHLLPERKRAPAARADDLYILGEYCHGGPLGRVIFLYYGSFERIFGSVSSVQLRRELRKTIRHEFRHHMESLGGEYGLELEDKRCIEAYWRSHLSNSAMATAEKKPWKIGLLKGLRFRRRPFGENSE